jgi:hypothetical protein
MWGFLPTIRKLTPHVKGKKNAKKTLYILPHETHNAAKEKRVLQCSKKEKRKKRKEEKEKGRKLRPTV